MLYCRESADQLKQLTVAFPLSIIGSGFFLFLFFFNNSFFQSSSIQSADSQQQLSCSATSCFYFFKKSRQARLLTLDGQPGFKASGRLSYGLAVPSLAGMEALLPLSV